MRFAKIVDQVVDDADTGRVRRAAEPARAELASALGSAPSPEAEAKAKTLLERLGGDAHGPRAAA